MIRSILFASLLLIAGESFALQCVKTGTVCADSTPCKTISGVQVCLTDPAINATCWKYTDTYNCLAQNPVDYCSAIGSTAGCQQVDSVCTTPGATPGSGCMKWTNTYRCGASTTPRNNNLVLDTSYTTSTDVTSASQCVSAADNPTCTVAENINGVRSYTCMSQSSNCAALQTQGCTLNTSTCVSPAGGTAANCMLYEKSYSCSVKNYSCPTGQTLNGTSCQAPAYLPSPTPATVSYSCPSGQTLNGTDCQAPLYLPPSTPATVIGFSCPIGYRLQGNLCASGFGIVFRMIAATTVYSCPSGQTLSGTSCQAPAYLPSPTPATVSYSCPSGQTLNGTDCQAPLYLPPSTPATLATSTVLDCGSQQYCTGGNCFNSGHAPDTDFSVAIATQEVGRQAMTYIDPNQRLFNGEAGSCVHNSISRCCDPSGGAVKNSSMGGTIKRTAGGQVLKAGSAYMYDIGSSAYNALRGGQSMLAAAAGAAGSGFSMGAYGLTMSWSAGAGFSFAFDPTSFAIAVAILVVVEITSCPKDEKDLAQKNGAGLCRQWSSTCNGYFCPSVTRRYCCFNSKLAKIINTAAVAQLGRANSDCTGLTMAEFGSLNFAAIDLGEFTAEIMANIQLPTTVNAAVCANGVPPDVTGTCADGSVPSMPPNGVDAIKTDANNSIQQKLLNYYTTGRQ